MATDGSSNYDQHPNDPSRAADRSEPDPEVLPGNSSFGNRYTRAYKLRILRAADACDKPGEIGQLLRKEGLLHTTLTSFRRQRAAGALDAPEPAGSKPRQKPVADAEQSRRAMQLEKEVRQLKRRLAQAEAIIDVQKKLSQLLSISLEEEVK